MRRADLAEKLRSEQDETRAAAEERARPVERQADANAAKNKEDEQAHAIAQTETEAKAKAEKEAKQEVKAKTVLVDRQAECERALRLHVQGLQQIEIGNVSAARQFFALATDAGLRKSAVALAGTYDPVQLDRLKVLGVQPDEDTARKWYEKARDLGAIAALCPEAVREEAEFPTTPALAADKPAAGPDTDLAQFRAAYTSGDGLAYVVIKDEKGEHVYRYGDASRLTAKKDTRGYMLFTCNAPHVFAPRKAEDTGFLSTTSTPSEEPRTDQQSIQGAFSCSAGIAFSRPGRAVFDRTARKAESRPAASSAAARRAWP